MDEQKRSRQLGFEIASIHNLMRRKQSSLPDGERLLPYKQAWMIGYIRSQDGRDVFQNDLEHEFKMTGATASNLLKRMERDGLVLREPVPGDRRKKRLILTDKAVRIVDDIHTHILETEARMTRGISEEELEAFFRIADKIKENLQIQESE